MNAPLPCFDQAFEEAKMEDKVRKMQLLKDNEKKELVSTLQNGEFFSKW